MHSLLSKSRKSRSRIARPISGELVSKYTLSRRNLRGARTKDSMSILDHNSTVSSNSSANYLPNLLHTFGITQTWRCAPKEYVAKVAEARKAAGASGKYPRESNKWVACDQDLAGQKANAEVSVMGYSMRTMHFRYTAWIHFDRKTMLPDLSTPPLDEELYDHRNELLSDFTHRETFNLARKSGSESILLNLRYQLIDFLRNNVVYRGRI
jgi:hypothetical protein